MTHYTDEQVDHMHAVLREAMADMGLQEAAEQHDDHVGARTAHHFLLMIEEARVADDS